MVKLPKLMCGRFALHADQQMLAIHFDCEPLPPTFAPERRFNIAPSTWNPAILATPPRGVEGDAPRHTRLMKWGLHPAWAGEKPKISPINSRAETILEKRMFSSLMKRNRCIIPVNGWYEWLRDGKLKRPFYHYHRDEEPLALAALWTSWTSSDGDSIESFTIITCEASERLGEVHSRMPALLAREDWGVWLDGSMPAEVAVQCVDADRVHAAAGEIDLHEVSTAVNSVANQGEELLTPLT